MSVIDLRREGDVFVLTMTAGENRFNRPFLNDMKPPPSLAPVP